MSGRSALVEVMDGVGPVSALAAEMAELEHAMGDPDRVDDMDNIVARYGEVQSASTSSTAMRSTAAPARCSAAWGSARR